MKKQLILIGLLLVFFAGYSQEIEDEMVTKKDSMVTDSICHHRINIYFSGAFTNNIYHRVDGIKYDKIHPCSHSLSIGYTYFFNKNWGLGLGVGITRQIARANMNINSAYKIEDASEYSEYSAHYTTYTLLFNTRNLIEKQEIWAIEVPLTAQYENKFGGKNGIYAMLGVKGYFPISNKSSIANGEIEFQGYDSYYDVLYHDMPNHGFLTANIKGQGSAKLRCSIDLQADFGGVFTINNKVDFYVGAFCTYGFLDILPKANKRHDLIEMVDLESPIKYNGLLGSNFFEYSDRATIASMNTGNAKNVDLDKKDVIGNFKWHNLQVGIKLGLHIKPCGTVEPSARKKFYQKMSDAADVVKQAAQKYLDDTCSMCDRNTEYIYILPVTPNRDENGNKLSRKDKGTIKDLAQSLSKVKILFDLDKDVPKINESGEHIDKCVDILKSDNNLKVIIEGYTCSLGSEEHNRDLAKRRAESIKRMFVEKGVNPNQIETVSYTANDKENAQNITDPSKEEHRAAIFRIVKR